MRRTIVILAVLAMLLGVLALPALSAGPFTYRETETASCAYNQDVKSRIKAVGDHKHSFIGLGTVEIDLPWATKISTVTWDFFEGSVRLYNQNGGTYYWTSSYAYCG